MTRLLLSVRELRQYSLNYSSRSARTLWLLGMLSGLALSGAGQAMLPQADRVLADVDSQNTVRLAGYLPSWAKESSDLGAPTPGTAVRLTFVLERSSEREAAFKQVLADQQNPASKQYHQWLTPQQIGTLYGPTQHDLDALTHWLEGQGLALVDVSPSRVLVRVEAPASRISAALGTSFHTYKADAAEKPAGRLAVVQEPSLPAALVPLVRGIVGLYDAATVPALHTRTIEMPAGKVQGARPRSTDPYGNHYLAPADFATIYTINSLYESGIDGTGENIAVIGRSRVQASDITAFEALFNLASHQPNVVIPPMGTDPGTTGQGDQAEATLDVQRAIGTAPGAKIDLVVSGGPGDGVEAAAEYEVQTLLDPIMTISFGSCEAEAGQAGVSFWDSLFSQAAAEGITSFAAAGDGGANGCAGPQQLASATQTRSINAICASSYVTCVGGTEFADFAEPGAYWGSTNQSGLASAVGYIQEGAWNEPTTTSSTGTTSYVDFATGGGVSSFITKPAWQTGPGVPADGYRDVPDVSFSSSSHDGYLGCLAIAGSDCTQSVTIFSGTSTATPSMAAIGALLNQKLGRQGTLNPLLYEMAASPLRSNDQTDGFHDATPATSGVALCDTAAASMCNNSVPSPSGLSGGLAGYALTAGYDQATGLGSLNVSGLVAEVNAKTSLAVLEIYVVASSTINVSQTTTLYAELGPSVAGTITGTVQFYSNGIALGAPVPVDERQQTATIFAQSFPAVGTYAITATYLGDATYASVTSTAFTVTVTPAPTATTTTTLSIASPTLALNGSDAFTVTVAPTAAGGSVPTGSVEFYANGIPISALPLTSGTGVTYSASSLAPVGTQTITAMYLGDADFLESTSAPQTVTVTKGPTSLYLTPLYGDVATGAAETYSATISFASVIAGPTGTVEFFQGGVSVGSAPVMNGRAISPPQMYPMAGTYAVTATYSGDANYLGSTSASASATASAGPPYQFSGVPQPITVVAGATAENGTYVGLVENATFVGNVTLSCVVAFNGGGTVSFPPTCIFQGNYFAFPAGNGASDSLLVIETTAPHAVVSAVGITRPFGGASAVAGPMLAVLLMTWRRRLRGSVLWSGGALLCLLVIAGCGGGSSSNPGGGNSGGGGGSPPSAPQVVGTTPGSYTITVSATNTAGLPNPAPIQIGLTVQ